MNKILIFDQDWGVCMPYEDELVAEGYDVVTSGDYTNVLPLIEQEKPDLIILDADLTRLRGLNILQDIRNVFYDIPVILCSTWPDLKYDRRCISADYVVCKTSNLGDLKEKIEMAIKAGIYVTEGSFNGIGDMTMNDTIH